MKIVGYIRVSTAKQGESGLGLEAQTAAIDLYAKANGGEVVKAFREVESGKNNDRPELAKAVAYAKRIKARLVIAKLDRLARNVHLVSGLMESGIDFIACDNPNANKLTVHILAAVAEDEAERISARTKAALSAAKARGVVLGSARPGHWEGREDARVEGAHKGGEAMRRKMAKDAAPIYSEALPVARKLHGEGKSLRAIAEALNGQGMTTLRGAEWNAMQVKRLLERAG